MHLIGQTELIKSLQKDFQKERISTLCKTVSSDGSFTFECLSAAKPLVSFLDDFYAITYKYPNEIFNRFWQQRLTKILTIVLSDVALSLWRPVLQSCVSLLAKLESGDMTLFDIDHQFKLIYFNKRDKLEHDLINLQRGVNAIKHVSSDTNWIRKVVMNIGQYWDLCSYREAAEAVLKIRDALKLTGDFAIVERVASNKVPIFFLSFYFCCQQVFSGAATLSSVDDSVVNAGRFLQEYATDPTKIECVIAFAECQNIVEWIRKETRGKLLFLLFCPISLLLDVTNLVTFVTVALATAAGGEDDMITNKLSFLRTVGSGFGPLIYRLPQNASYQTLQECCKTLWVTLATAPNLAFMMVSL